MSAYIPSVERLIEKFRKLPGIGYKSAVRLAFHVLSMDEKDAQDFADAIMDSKRLVKTCSVCMNISETDVCDICSSPKRDHGLICVVENSRDVAAIEKLNDYNGLYHVLGGLLSPLNGIGPEHLKLKELLARVQKDEVREVIVATNPSVEGEATAMYISRLMRPFGVMTTRLAYGLPAGSELEYADELTLSRAFEGRRTID